MHRPSPAHRTDPSSHTASRTPAPERPPSASPSFHGFAARNYRLTPLLSLVAARPQAPHCDARWRSPPPARRNVEHQHVVEDLDHLAASDGTAVRDVVPHGLQNRLD